ncbi:MAG: hypothetical protein WC784_00905 [Candidatus Shapirobacteria bacterium]|jgi:hypothetical protein
MKKGDTSNLNLLPSQAKFQAAKMKLQKTLHYYMSLVGILWFAIVILVVVLYFGSTFVLNLQNTKYKQALNGLQSLSSDIVTGQLLKYRAKVLGEVLKNRFEYSTAFEKINSLFGSEVKVTDFVLEGKNQFTVTTQTTGKNNVDSIENKVEEINLGKVDGVSKTIISSADQDGENWSIKMELYLK